MGGKSFSDALQCRILDLVRLADAKKFCANRLAQCLLSGDINGNLPCRRFKLTQVALGCCGDLVFCLGYRRDRWQNWLCQIQLNFVLLELPFNVGAFLHRQTVRFAGG